MENFIPKRLNRHETIEQIIADLLFGFRKKQHSPTNNKKSQ